MKHAIAKVFAQVISDSRERPTLLVTVEAGSYAGSFAVPSGASTGAHEAIELRDPDGRGVTQALASVNELISPALLGHDVLDQRGLDKLMCEQDGTENKSRLGANAIVGVSVAAAKCAASASGVETWQYIQKLFGDSRVTSTPKLFMNLVNGGLHAQTRLVFQEYHVVPKTQSAAEALEIGKRVQDKLAEIVEQRLAAEKHGKSIVWGDEGGIALDVSDPEVPLQLLREACESLGILDQVDFALDVAASSFYKNTSYQISSDKNISESELLEYYKMLATKYPLVSIEDPFDEESFEMFAKLRKELPNLIVVGDDLTVTNPKRIARAIKERSISGVIIKLNQIGTLSETCEAINLARENGVRCIVSHRSGETTDYFIADLAYAVGAYGLKSGAPKPKERLLKYNRLVSITNT